jgi:hypothetical protein
MDFQRNSEGRMDTSQEKENKFLMQTISKLFVLQVRRATLFCYDPKQFYTLFL